MGRPVSKSTVLAPFRLALMTGKMAYCEGMSINLGPSKRGLRSGNTR
jgi:hypothetical protein